MRKSFVDSHCFPFTVLRIHVPMKFVTAETQSTFLILSQLKGTREGGEENKERGMRDTKGASDVYILVNILNEWFASAGGLHQEPFIQISCIIHLYANRTAVVQLQYQEKRL